MAATTDVPLPPTRFRMGGEHFRSDEGFLAGAEADVRTLVEHAGLGPDSRVLDWGCGAGRLNIGIKRTFGHVRRYHGVDVQEPLIRWARQNLRDEHTGFSLVNAHNDRYNPEGEASYSIPQPDGTVDVFHAYSVFSHMTTADVAGYSGDIARLLAPEGRAWLTAFAEEAVPDCVENPDDFRTLDWKGPLHCVRFNRQFLEALWWEAGLRVVSFVHGQETDGQSAYVLARR